MALERMVKPGDRIRAPLAAAGPTVLIVDHVLPSGVVICTYADGRLKHGLPATTSFIARFADGSLNTWMEHAP